MNEVNVPLNPTLSLSQRRKLFRLLGRALDSLSFGPTQAYTQHMRYFRSPFVKLVARPGIASFYGHFMIEVGRELCAPATLHFFSSTCNRFS